MHCPRCIPTDVAGPYRSGDASHLRGVTLARERHAAGVELDRCPSCSGAWLDHGELGRIQDAAQARGGARREEIVQAVTQRAYARARSREERAPLVCPGCGEEMVEREWRHGSHILVDVCVGCRGAWVDAGELGEIEHFAGGSLR